jgi:hypothetical protein
MDSETVTDGALELAADGAALGLGKPLDLSKEASVHMHRPGASLLLRRFQW